VRKVAVVGADMTPFGEHFALGIKDLLPTAFAECAASVDKGIDKTDPQVAWFGSTGTTDGILADSLGLPDLPVTRVENSCATGNDAVRNALFGIASGACDVALVMGADKPRETVNHFDGARIALEHNIGGPTAVSAITILEGPETYGD
jgi:acetyl-CoA C-acetyltransferase